MGRFFGLAGIVNLIFKKEAGMNSELNLKTLLKASDFPARLRTRVPKPLIVHLFSSKVPPVSPTK